MNFLKDATNEQKLAFFDAIEPMSRVSTGISMGKSFTVSESESIAIKTLLYAFLSPEQMQSITKELGAMNQRTNEKENLIGE